MVRATGIFCALVFLCASAAPAEERLLLEQPRGKASSDGSLLRQVSGVMGLEPRPDEATAEPQAPEAPFGVPAPENGMAYWSNPHGIGQSGDCADDDAPFFTPFFSTAMIPFWGHRTPTHARYTGYGQPLLNSSWRNRPFHAGVFFGGTSGDFLIRDRVDQTTGVNGGIRLGWDYDYYWGLEMRLAGSHFGVRYVAFNNPPRSNQMVIWDTEVLYYPWGDARWRPFLLAGLGLTTVYFRDETNVRFRRALVEIPWGIGVKYRFRETLVFRADLVDNVAFGSGVINTMNNISLTVGVEWYFGGVRRSYWPWNPGRILP